MKTFIACVFALTVINGALADRKLMQLPILPSSTSQTAGSGPVPAPSPSDLPKACALEYLVNAGNFNTLIELVEAASKSADIAQILDSPASRVTLLAPTDSGIQKALQALGITTDSLLADPARITDVLLYHVLPSQIQATDLIDGYSFNTQLVQNGIAQSVAVKGAGPSASFVGRQSSAASSGASSIACNINVIPIDGLLVP